MNRPAEAAVPPDDLELLEQVLRRLLADHERMLACLGRNREAIRRADMDAIKAVCEEQNAIVQRLAELEKSRLVLVGRLTQHLQPQAETPLSMRQIAEAVDEPAGRRLSAWPASFARRWTRCGPPAPCSRRPARRWPGTCRASCRPCSRR
jgi:hypothetical protein